MEHLSLQPQTSTSSLRWVAHHSDQNLRSAKSRSQSAQRNASTPTSISTPASTSNTISASATPVSQSLQQATPVTLASSHQILDLKADINTVLEHVAASREDHQEMSKDLDDLATKVKVLERILCGDVGRPRKKRKNTDSDPVNKGIAHRLVQIEAAIDQLLGLVTSLKATPCPPVVCRDASTSPCTPSPPVQKDQHLPATMPSLPSTRLFPPVFTSMHRSSEMLAPVNWNANLPNSRCASLPAFSPYLQEHNRKFQRDPSSSGSTESTAHPHSTTPLDGFNTASYPVTRNVSFRLAPNTLHTKVSANEPDRFLSSSLATPSPDSPRGESFGRAHHKSNTKSLAGSQPGLSGIGQDSTMASPSRTPQSFFNPTTPSSVETTRIPARIPPKFNSRNFASPLKSNPTLPLATPPSHHQLPASNSAPILPTPPPSSFLSSSSPHPAAVHSTSPTRTPNSALTRARAASLSRMLSGAQPNVGIGIGGNEDCEGLCADCEQEHREHQEHLDESMDSLECQHQNINSQKPEPERGQGQEHQDQRMNSQGQCADEGTRDRGTTINLDTSVGQFTPLSQSVGANASANTNVDADTEASPPVPRDETVSEAGSVDPPLAFTTQPPPHTSSNDPSHAIAPDVEPCAPGPICTREVADEIGDETMRLDRASDDRQSGVVESDSLHEPTREVADANGDHYGADADESMQLDHASDVGGSGVVEPEPRHEDIGEGVTEEGLRKEPKDGNVDDGSLEESVKSVEERAPALAPNTGSPSQQTLENQDQYGYSRELTPADSLFQDEEAVAAALAASLSPENGSTPSPSFPNHLSAFLPLQSELEAQLKHGCLGGGVAGSPEHREAFNHDDDDYCDVSGSTYANLFSNFISADTDGASSAVRSTYAGTYVERRVQEPVATADGGEHDESDISAQLKYADPARTTLRSTSPSFRVSSLSPLSSLEDSPPPLDSETEERWYGAGVKPRRTENLCSDMDLGTRSGSSVSVALQTHMMPRGGPSASIDELSVLARRGPTRLNIKLSDLKRKLQSSQSSSAIEQPEKRTRIEEDVDNIIGLGARSSSMVDSVRNPRTGDPRRTSRPSTSMQAVTAFRAESISAQMGLNSASAVGAGSTRLSEKRIRPISRKARESTGSTQKVRQPRKNTSGTSNKRPPQKRKSKSLSAQNEALMCQWPAKSEQDGSFQRQFVQCDNCDLWYHFECVGIVEGDLRLDPEASFICPPCCVSTAKRQTLRNRDEKCARPDCLHAHVDEQEYMIERLVGRKPVGEAGYLFLVKWEGYPIAQATWIPEGNMGDATQTVVRFAADARAEGIDLGTKGAILLEEAKVGGWDV